MIDSPIGLGLAYQDLRRTESQCQQGCVPLQKALGEIRFQVYASWYDLLSCCCRAK